MNRAGVTQVRNEECLHFSLVLVCFFFSSHISLVVFWGSYVCDCVHVYRSCQDSHLLSVFVFMCTGPIKALFHLLSVFVFMCTGPFKVLFHLLSVIVFMCAGPVKTLFHLLSWNDDTHYKSGNFLQPLLTPNTDQLQSSPQCLN